MSGRHADRREPARVELSSATATRRPARRGRQLVGDQVASRLAAKDATLWGPDAEAEARSGSAGSTSPRPSRPLVAEIDALRAELRGRGPRPVVLCRHGRLVAGPRGHLRGPPASPLTVLDSTDPDQVRARARRTDLGRAPSSWSPASPAAPSRPTASGAPSSRRSPTPASTRASGSSSSPTPARRSEQPPRDDGLPRLPRRPGRRRPVLGADRVRPGADRAGRRRHRRAARRGRRRSAPALAADAGDNPALRSARPARRRRPGRRDKLVLAADGSGIVGFGDWAEQLIAESTGKDGTGVLPVVVECPTPPSFAPSRPTTCSCAPSTGGRRSTSATTPAGRVTSTARSARRSCSGRRHRGRRAAARHQPVRPARRRERQGRRPRPARRRAAEPAGTRPSPTARSRSTRRRAGCRRRRGTVAGAVAALLAGRRPTTATSPSGLPRPARDAAAGRRAADAGAAAPGRPVTFGWGPRFLHSTGQYHKGGPPRRLPADHRRSPSDDLAVPDRPFTFGELHRRPRPPATRRCSPSTAGRCSGCTCDRAAGRALDAVTAGGHCDEPRLAAARPTRCATRRTGGSRGSPGRAAW